MTWSVARCGRWGRPLNFRKNRFDPEGEPTQISERPFNACGDVPEGSSCWPPAPVACPENGWFNGTLGDIEALALAPSTVQECLDFTVEAFNLSEKYRNPVCVMTDGEVGHLRERIVIPDEQDMEIIDRVQATIEKKRFTKPAENHPRWDISKPITGGIEIGL